MICRGAGSWIAARSGPPSQRASRTRKTIPSPPGGPQDASAMAAEIASSVPNATVAARTSATGAAITSKRLTMVTTRM